MKIERAKNIKQIHALGSKVIIEIEAAKKESEGGIALIEDTVRSDQDKVTIGRLVDVGEKAFDEMYDAKKPEIGCIVYFVKYAGKEITCGDKLYRIINDLDIFGYEDVKDE